ncbi:MAG: glycosyltransferase [Bacteroidetes bacterium]|jgi:glycosyltransferase involved in cell wall biosynthesis|nr:glycosyltransferase [Bacteroidota bacterium]
MNILQVHNRYKITGGEWTVLNQEYDLLKKKHTINQLIVDNTEELDTLFNKLKLIFTTHYNRKSREMVREKIRKSGAEIMHVHNFFPLLSPSIFEASGEEGVPSVMTLHNYRLIYPNGYLMHDGNIDERTIHGSAYSCVLEGVYRNSMLQTAVVAHMIEYHRKRDTWAKKVDCLICLTEFAKAKFVEAGIPAEKMRVKPNFVDDAFRGKNLSEMIDQKDDYYLFIGRISEEKGIRTLVNAWNTWKSATSPQLFILGEGPLKKELQKKSQDNTKISWLGFVERSRVLETLSKAKALIFPSEWYEGMPMTIIEAYSAATPVISTNIGSQGEIVHHKRTGLHFEPGKEQSLVEALEQFESMKNEHKDMSLAARREYEEKYTPEVNREKLLSLYRELIKNT